MPQRRVRERIERTQPLSLREGRPVRATTWRPRASVKKLRLAVNAWAPLADLTERLAAFRGVSFDGFVDE